jgi:hypothetical protein
MKEAQENDLSPPNRSTPKLLNYSAFDLFPSPALTPYASPAPVLVVVTVMNCADEWSYTGSTIVRSISEVVLIMGTVSLIAYA